MKKVFSFMAGGICGALVGGVAALLLAPTSGEDLIGNAQSHWQSVLDDASQAREEKRQELESQFNAEQIS